MATPTFFGQNMAPAGGGAPAPNTLDILAAQVLDWQPEEAAADVGATPDQLEFEVFDE